MSENPAESAKVCGGCGADVTSKPRVKDATGRYFCRECAAKKQAELAKKVGKTAGGAAGAAAVGGMALETDSDMMSRLVDDSLAQGASSCPACRRTWRAGASICTHCGYNKATGQMVGTQIQAPELIKAPKVVGGKKAKRRGGKKFEGAHWKVALVLIAIFGAGFGVGMVEPQFGAIFMLGVSAYMFLFGVFAAMDAYMEHDSVLKAVAVFFCGLYALYYCIFETGNDLLKGTAWAYIVVFLLTIIGSATAGMGIGIMEGMGAGGGPPPPLPSGG